MITGREALATIEQAIGRARSSETELDSALRSAEEEAARLRAERAKHFRMLAKVRLDSFMQDGVSGSLDSAERRALELVHTRSMELKEQAAGRSSRFSAVRKGEDLRHDRASQLEQALAGYEAIRKASQGKIEASAPWKAQLAVISNAEKIAEESDKKAHLAEADREEKRKAYEGDSLFMYLWREKFGQAEYQGGLIARFFDRMIAKKVGFADARANYSMMNEIPLRLREHAERRKQAVREAKDGLAQAEAEALKSLGAGDLVGKVASARQALILAETALSSAQADLKAYEDVINAGKEDPAYSEAIEILAEADAREDLRELYREARETKTRDDELVVGQIEMIDAKLTRTEKEIEAIREDARSMARRRAEIERERDQFRRRGYDNPYGGFANESILGHVLGGILQGTIQGTILNDALKDNYRQRANPWNQDTTSSGSIFGPWTVPDWTNSPPPSSGNSGQWVPPWLEGGSGSSSGGSWGGGDSSGGGWGGGGGFDTGGDV